MNSPPQLSMKISPWARFRALVVFYVFTVCPEICAFYYAVFLNVPKLLVTTVRKLAEYKPRHF